MRTTSEPVFVTYRAATFRVMQRKAAHTLGGKHSSYGSVWPHWTPTKQQLSELVSDLEWAPEASIETLRWTASLEFPNDYEFVALRRAQQGCSVGKAARRAIQNEVDDLPPLGVECLHL